MRVRFVKAWSCYRVGQVIDPPGTLREFLCRRGFVVPADPPASEYAEVGSAGERAVTRRGRRWNAPGGR